MTGGKLTYYFNFIVLALTFAFIATKLITESFRSLDLILFSIFIILSMLSLIGIGEEKRWSWFLLMILFAFLIAYTVGLFVLAGSMTVFILIVINIIAFIFSTLSIKSNIEVPVPSVDKTEQLKKELADLVEEKRALEQEFDELKEEQLIYSPSSKYYHAESCEWAKRIKNRKVITEAEAKELKLKKHNCLK